MLYVQKIDSSPQPVLTSHLVKIANTKPLSGMVDVTSTDVTLDHSSHLKSDDEIRELVKERVETVYHPTSTCRMAPLDQGGVVDSELKVYGIEGLRVCDASIFPFILSGHTVRAINCALLVAMTEANGLFLVGRCMLRNC